MHDQIRGLSPFPGAFFEADLGKGKPERVKVLHATVAHEIPGAQVHGAPGALVGPDMTIACGRGAIRVLRAQRAGKSAVTAEEFMRGARLERILAQ